MRRVLAIAFLSAAISGPVAAQNFNQTIVFGDSNVDSGWYKNASSGSVQHDAAIAASGSRAAFTSPGLMSSEALAAFFGTTAIPANQPGGTNYATGGARDDLVNGPGSGLFQGAVPTTKQIANYLAANGGRANPNALYLISSGANDQNFAFANLSVANRPAYFTAAATALADSIAQLQAAGARYIIVPGNNFTGPNFGAIGTQQSYDFLQSLWNGLHARGVNFIPADRNAVFAAIRANPTSFGFTNIEPGDPLGPNTGACKNPYLLGSAWSLTCTTANLVSPNAGNTFLFADDGHLAAAGQKIMADYFYSLIVAPSQISMLAESAVKARSRFVAMTQNQIDVSQNQRGPQGFNAWVTGDISHLEVNNYHGFPDDPATPATIAAGIDFRLSRNLIVGGVISTTTQRSSFSTAGDFTQDEIAGSVYAAFRGGAWWANLIATYGHLDYAVNRTVPIGITLQYNSANTSGSNWSVATEAGYKFTQGWLTHGPVVGLTLQRVYVDDFTESGNFTSLAFAGQTRHSLISSLGYRVTADWGAWRPFVQASWNHELADTDRDVTAFLTTVTAPGFSMPAVEVGKDWGTANLGTTLKLGNGVSVLGVLTSEFSQRDVTTYGGQIGINIAF